jgi:hypothetical protein
MKTLMAVLLTIAIATTGITLTQAQAGPPPPGQPGQPGPPPFPNPPFLV